MFNEDKNNTQVEKLQKQLATIQAKLERAENLKRERQRKADTRRKILLGAFMLEKLQAEGSYESIKSDLDKFLTRPNDRKLFGLEINENEE